MPSKLVVFFARFAPIMRSLRDVPAIGHVIGPE